MAGMDSASFEELRARPHEFLEGPGRGDELALQLTDPLLKGDDLVGVFVTPQIAVAVGTADTGVAQVFWVGFSAEDGAVDAVVALDDAREDRIHLFDLGLQALDFGAEVGELPLPGDVRWACEQILSDPNAREGDHADDSGLAYAPHHIIPHAERRLLHLEGPFVEPVLVEPFRHGSKSAV